MAVDDTGPDLTDGFENHRFRSGDLSLVAHLACPPLSGDSRPGVVICHGFPSGPGGGANSVATFPELAFRIATEMGWVAMVPYMRGMGNSEGDFSLDGWRDDVAAAAADLRGQDSVEDVWAVGFGTGASLAICAAAVDPEIRGVAALAAPADWSDWAANPRRLLLHARQAGVIATEEAPTDFERWSAALREVSAERSVAELGTRDLLLIHGSDDEVVPSLDARVLASGHGIADLRMIAGAGHHLRHDPRAIAMLLGWLDRQRRQHG